MDPDTATIAPPFTPQNARRELAQVRDALLAMATALLPDERIGPKHELVNPPHWELGHIAWFQEKWCLRRRPAADPNESPLLSPLSASRHPWSDWLFDSSRIPHDARWHAPLTSWNATLDYAADVLSTLFARIGEQWPEDDPDLPHFAELSLLHEAMHLEAWWMQWQLLGRTPPVGARIPWPEPDDACPAGGPDELAIPGGIVVLGTDARGFAFDNERPTHEVEVAACRIDTRPVSFGDFAGFIDAGGYRDARWWTPAGWQWRTTEQREHPAYWRQHGSQWQHRVFAEWLPLPQRAAIRHITAHEAEAYAAWRGRRLPSAAEWQRASADPAFIRGRTWEWTASDFLPYPGFHPGPYTDYSRPWFGSHRELRGGSPHTHFRLARPNFRNFYLPSRHDPICGFRTARSRGVE